ncbi:MAG: DUF86 domain-containing protein [Sulfurimonas sp.]|nr:DUF86 domain-containing protein [Sulfurimonas sp.]
MSKRTSMLYVNDILESIEAIESYLKDTDFEKFQIDRKTYSATIREFIVIGEAISKIIEILQEASPNYPWRMIKDFRNFIIHEYFGVNPKIVYDAATLELDELKKIIKLIKEERN